MDSPFLSKQMKRKDVHGCQWVAVGGPQQGVTVVRLRNLLT